MEKDAELHLKAWLADKGRLNEALLQLYLRLAGYFVTGLISHGNVQGQSRGEVDCFAVRHQHHTQPDRGVLPPPFLGLQAGITDLLICDSKSNLQNVRFNNSMRDNPETLRYTLRWSGLFTEEQLDRIVDKAILLFREDIRKDEAERGVIVSNVRIRALLCCPPMPDDQQVDRWLLRGGEIVRFANECFNPVVLRADCSTKYSKRLWGSLDPVVRYFKEGNGGKAVTLRGLYTEFGIK